MLAIIISSPRVKYSRSARCSYTKRRQDSISGRELCKMMPAMWRVMPEPSRRTPEPSVTTPEPSIPTRELAIPTPEIAKPTRAKTSLRGNKQTVTPPSPAAPRDRKTKKKNKKQRSKRKKEKLTRTSPHHAYWPRPPSDPTRGHGSNDGGRPVKHPWMRLSASARPRWPPPPPRTAPAS